MRGTHFSLFVAGTFKTVLCSPSSAMATSEENDIHVENNPRNQMSQYARDIEEDITPARILLEEYSKVPPDQVIAHIHAVVCYQSNSI